MKTNHLFKTMLLCALSIPFLCFSCTKTPAESYTAAREAETQLTPYQGQTVLQPYSVPGGDIVLPFTEERSVRIGRNAIKTISDDGEILSIVFINGSRFSFNNNVKATIPADGPLASFRFTLKDNPYILLGDLACSMDGNAVTCHLPYLTDNRLLTPEIKSRDGYKLSLRGEPGKDIHSATDFSKAVVYDVQGEGRTDSVVVNLISNTRLPVISMVTGDGKDILQKEYRDATITIDDNPLSPTHGTASLEATGVKVKGRGNSSWMMPKKPYKLKFDKKVSLLGEAEGKQWVLLANAYDPALGLHNHTGFEMSRLLGLDWTPCSHFVDLFINHTYRGTYQLTEQIKINKNRVNVTDDGFIVEIDQHMKIDADDVTFKTPKIKNLTIKDPDVEKGSDQYNAIVKTVRDFEETLYGEQWLDPDTGYKTLADIKSFARWYVIHEISNHADHVFGSSCYFHKAPKGKITMGPVWDFDKSFGTLTGETATAPSRLQHAPWFERLFQDPAFVEEVNRQFTLFREAIPQLNDWIDETYNYLLGAYVENNIRWGSLTLKSYDYDAVIAKAAEEKEKTKKYISDRAAWLDTNLPE